MNITRKIFLAAAATAFFASVPMALAQSPMRSPDDIDQLVGPIALYPDPLVSVVLPASTMPGDIQQAASLVANGDIGAVDGQPWDDSVRAVAHYPDLVEWMSDNIDWTAQLGATFATQPADVLNSVQRLRARARAVGTLVDTPQQRVVIEGGLIAIVPAEPSRIYVPRYDPAVVYVDHPPWRGASVFTFGAGFALGAWLDYDFDWGRHSIVVEDRAWAEHRDWTRPSFSDRARYAAAAPRREWHPSPNRATVNVNISRTVVTPHAFGDRTANAGGQRPPTRDQRSDRERERSPDANRNNQGALGLGQNPQPSRPVAPPPAPAAQPPPARALSANEQQRIEQQRAEAQRQQKAPEPRRPVPRGSMTAGSTGEYPRPPEAPEKKDSTPNLPANGPERDRRMAEPRRPDEREPQPPAAAPQATRPEQPRRVPPAEVKAPPHRDGTPPKVETKAATDDEKAKKQQQEDDDKKKRERKSDDSDGR